MMRNTLLLVCCVLMLASFTQALAADETLDCTYVRITENGFIADTLFGVEARYNLGGRTLYCYELIQRFYKELFGLDVQAAGGSLSVLNSDEYWFETTDTPVPGDVLYGSASMRGKSYSHWAICKEIDPETNLMTLFEQNWRWYGQAGICRKIAHPSRCYRYLTLCNAEGRVLVQKATAKCAAAPVEIDPLSVSLTMQVTPAFLSLVNDYTSLINLSGDGVLVF